MTLKILRGGLLASYSYQAQHNAFPFEQQRRIERVSKNARKLKDLQEQYETVNQTEAGALGASGADLPTKEADARALDRKET